MYGSVFHVNRKYKIEKSPFGNTRVLRVPTAPVPAAVSYSITFTTARKYRSAATISHVHSNSGFPYESQVPSHKRLQPLISLECIHYLLTRPSLTYIYQIDTLVKKNLAQLRGSFAARCTGVVP